MNALPRWLLLALFALLIVAPSESFFASSSFGARCGDSRRLAELPGAARAALLADLPLRRFKSLRLHCRIYVKTQNFNDSRLALCVQCESS